MNNLLATLCAVVLFAGPLTGCDVPSSTTQPAYNALDADGGMPAPAPVPAVDATTPTMPCAEGYITTTYRPDGSSIRDYVYVTLPLATAPAAAYRCDYTPLPRTQVDGPHDYTTCALVDPATDFTTAYGGTRVICGWRHEETALGGGPLTVFNEGALYRNIAVP